MQYRDLGWVFAHAVVGLFFAQVANAACPLSCSSSTYDSTTKSKFFPDRDLVCHEDEDSGGVTFNVSDGISTPSRNFVISGFVTCSEFYNELAPANLQGTEVPFTTGHFTIEQSAMSPTSEATVGLLFQSTGVEDGDMDSWIFQVDGSGGTDETYRTKLIPSDQPTRDIYCFDQNGDPVPAANCWLTEGTQDHARATDHPQTTIGGVTLFEGQAWRMDFIHDQGQRIPLRYVRNVCHALSFLGSDPVQCATKGKLKLLLRSTASATIRIEIGVEFDPAVINRNDTAASVDVVLLSEIGFDPATVDPSSVRIGDSGGVDTVTPTACSFSYRNADSVPDLVCTTTIGDLDTLSDVASFEPGAGVDPELTLNVTAHSAVGEAEFVGSYAITIELLAAVDIRPGCGNVVSVNNPDKNATDPASINGGAHGTWCTGQCDITPAALIDPTKTRFAFASGDLYLDLDTGTDPQGLVDVSGAQCAAGQQGWDGTTDGTLDQRYTFSVSELINGAGLASCTDGTTYLLPVMGEFFNGTPWRSVAAIECQSNN